MEHEPDVTCALSVIEKAWEKRDGGHTAVVDTAIVEMLVVAPTETILWLSQHSKITDSLVSSMQFTVFTDFDGTQKDKLAKLKDKAIWALKETTCADGKSKNLKQELLNSLGKIKIRTIN